MNRRSPEHRGYVNFPVESAEYKNSGEGGMFVNLVVCEKDDTEWDDQWMLCFGGGCNIIMDETFLGDDVHKASHGEDDPPKPTGDEVVDKEAFNQWAEGWNKRSFGAAGNFHFPNCYEKPSEIEKEYYGKMLESLSIEYLATITMGSTGWSGFREEKEGYWHCTYADLTEEGKALYDSIKRLYGETCQLYLQTWLDT